MTKANKAQAFNALNTFADSRVALIQGMKDAGYKTVEECSNVVIEWACEKTGCTFTTTKAGKNRLVSKHKKYESAKTVVRDVMLMIEGTTQEAKQPQGVCTEGRHHGMHDNRGSNRSVQRSMRSKVWRMSFFREAARARLGRCFKACLIGSD